MDRLFARKRSPGEVLEGEAAIFLTRRSQAGAKTQQYVDVLLECNRNQMNKNKNDKNRDDVARLKAVGAHDHHVGRPNNTVKRFGFRNDMLHKKLR